MQLPERRLTRSEYVQQVARSVATAFNICPDTALYWGHTDSDTGRRRMAYVTTRIRQSLKLLNWRKASFTPEASEPIDRAGR